MANLQALKFLNSNATKNAVKLYNTFNGLKKAGKTSWYLKVMVIKKIPLKHS